MSGPRAEAGACVEVVFSEADRRVEVRLHDGVPDGSSEQLTDELVHVLGIEDPDEAEESLRAGVAGLGTVRRVG